MNETNKKFFWLAGLMTTLTLVSMAVSFSVLWSAAIEQKLACLEHFVQIQGRLIESIARSEQHKVINDSKFVEPSAMPLLSEPFNNRTLQQLFDAHAHYDGFGDSSEMLMASVKNDNIVFFLRHQQTLDKTIFDVPWQSQLAEPMRRALSGLSGSMRGLDYKGDVVLAAYEPIAVLNAGLVAKISLAEVNQPFVRAGIIVLLITFGFVVLGGWVFYRLTRPITDEFMVNEQKFKNLVENVNEWIWEIDVDGTLLYSSPKSSMVIGWKNSELIGRSLYDFMASIDAEALCHMLLKGSKTRTAIKGLECTFMNNQHDIVEIELSAEPVLNGSNRVSGYRGVAHDISERKQKEHQLNQYRDNLEKMVTIRTSELEQANEELRHFAYIVSHDLRSPLVSITGFVGELKTDIEMIADYIKTASLENNEPSTEITTALVEAIPESLHYIETATEKMNRLINAILTLSRIGRRELKYEQVDMNQVVENTLQAMAFQLEQLNVKLKVADLPVMTTDYLAMEQIFGNLLDNAVKYLDSSRRGEILIDCSQQPTQLSFQIVDNGIGIREEAIPYIFDLFKRAVDHGIAGEGMGLTYVKTLVRRLGGQISCQSVLGQGSTFSFTLPLNGKDRLP